MKLVKLWQSMIRSLGWRINCTCKEILNYLEAIYGRFWYSVEEWITIIRFWNNQWICKDYSRGNIQWGSNPSSCIRALVKSSPCQTVGEVPCQRCFLSKELCQRSSVMVVEGFPCLWGFPCQIIPISEELLVKCERSLLLKELIYFPIKLSPWKPLIQHAPYTYI